MNITRAVTRTAVIVALAGGLGACGSSGSALDMTGIPVPTQGTDGTWQFQFASGVNVTGNLCSAKARQLKERLKERGVAKGTAGMVALDGGNNAPGTMTICALGY